jgi:hypothetical protein
MSAPLIVASRPAQIALNPLPSVAQANIAWRSGEGGQRTWMSWELSEFKRRKSDALGRFMAKHKPSCEKPALATHLRITAGTRRKKTKKDTKKAPSR